MANDYEELLEFLEADGESSLYSQREKNFSRITFQMETTLYRFIRDGKPDEMIAFYKNVLLTSPGMKIPVGITSMDRLRQLKYAAVSAVAIACRAAILGGVTEAAAYSRSDDAILRIDGMKTVTGVMKCEVQTLLEYARMVQRCKPGIITAPRSVPAWSRSQPIPTARFGWKIWLPGPATARNIWRSGSGRRWECPSASICCKPGWRKQKLCCPPG